MEPTDDDESPATPPSSSAPTSTTPSSTETPSGSSETAATNGTQSEPAAVAAPADSPETTRRVVTAGQAALGRLEGLGLLARQLGENGEEDLALTHRGRLLGGGVTVELLV